MEITKIWRVAGSCSAGIGLFTLIALAALGAGRLGMEVDRPAAQPQRQAQPRQPVPKITIQGSTEPNNQAVHLMACAHGTTAACVQAGAWMIAQAEMGHSLSVCILASGGSPKDVTQCTGIEAEWPE